jgi:hypothetical protein
MLQAINDRIKGWLGIVIVVLIGLPFALWGIQSYLDDTGPIYAARSMMRKYPQMNLNVVSPGNVRRYYDRMLANFLLMKRYYVNVL